MKRKQRKTERGSEEENQCADPLGSIQKGGFTATIAATAATVASVGYDDEVIPSFPPSGNDVTSRCNKHEYKWFLRPVPTVTQADLIESRRNRKREVNGNKASRRPNK